MDAVVTKRNDPRRNADDTADLGPLLTLMASLSGMMMGYAILTALRLRIADALQSGPMDASQIAAKTDTDADAVRRLLRALSTEGVFQELPDGSFDLTETSQFMRTDHPMSVSPRGDLLGLQDAWAALEYSIKTGRAAYPHAVGLPFWDSLSGDPQQRDAFDLWMTLRTRLMVVPAVLEYDWDHPRRIVDVGGGRGVLLESVLAVSDGAHGVLLDREEALPTRSTRNELSARIDIVYGDMFDGVPAGADVYILAQVLHDWDDQDCVRILRNCRNAMSAGAVVLVCEMVMPEGPEPHPAKWLDLSTLTLFGTRERTIGEFSELFERAGLRLRRQVDTRAGICLLEAAAQD